jgi:putative pyruvate formate lyase activating enzyme
VFCQNFDISWQVHGEPVTPRRLAAMMLELQDRGCDNINFVTPEHVVPQILQALPRAIERGLRLPIVYNTSCYDSLDSLALMDGIVDIYLPDLKVWAPGGPAATCRCPATRRWPRRRSRRCTARSARSASAATGWPAAGCWYATW